MSGEVDPLLATLDLRAITDSIHDYAIFVLDPEGVVRSWNTGARRLKGYTEQEIVGQSFTRFYGPEDLAAGRPHQLLAEAARAGRVEEEGWRIRKDGTRFWADVLISAIRDDGGRLLGFVKVTRDLTQRRRAEEELRQSEERMRLMIGSVKDYALFMLDPDGRVTSWNTGAQALKGYTAAEIIGRHVSVFYPPGESEEGKAERELAQAASEGRFEEEGWRVRKDGSRFWANVVLSAVRGEDGTLIGFTKVTRDMTERKRAQEQLARRAQQQLAVAALGVYALRTPELKLVVQQATRTVAEALGIPEVRLVQSADSLPQERSEAFPIHAPDGGGLPYGWLVVPAGRSLQGDEPSFVQSVANVVATALARAHVEQQLRSAEQAAMAERERTLRAEQALQERDDFVSVAAHELRTPLTALQLKLQGLERASTQPGTAARLEGAIRQTRRLAQLVDRLLDVSRVAHARLEMAPEEFDLVALVRQVVDDFRDPAAQARSPLQVDLPESAQGRWDRMRIEQVLVNVLSNAVKYGAGQPIAVKLEVEDDRVRLTVADRGIGIAEEDLARVFERFQRAAPIRHYSGIGLGLYISRHIVEAHGGTISVKSRRGEGATFTIDLPRIAAQDREQARA